ncbi:MAG: hypothetical protein ABJ007_10240 [Pseudophaeobacter sp.]|uniref:hypothetical protein n=1 Tax=Pseudophaeobacter sp. TaxID=1971739 RepID=UPI0032970448
MFRHDGFEPQDQDFLLSTPCRQINLESRSFLNTQKLRGDYEKNGSLHPVGSLLKLRSEITLRPTFNDRSGDLSRNAAVAVLQEQMNAAPAKIQNPMPVLSHVLPIHAGCSESQVWFRFRVR